MDNCSPTLHIAMAEDSIMAEYSVVVLHHSKMAADTAVEQCSLLHLYRLHFYYI